MAHFYASIQGNRGEVTRLGTKNSGIVAHIRGWNIGVFVSINHVNGEDVIVINKTGGSNSSLNNELLVTLKESEEV